MIRSIARLLLPVMCVLFLRSEAWPQALRVMETGPADHAVIDGTLNTYYVRFDRPVDHIRSVLMIERGGQVIETLQPRFKAAPEVLFASAPTLAPGDYRLRWSVRTLEGADVVEGAISFTIALPKR